MPTSLRLGFVAKPPTPETYTAHIPEIFQQVQASTANHNKNCVALAKLFSGCTGIYEEVQSRGGCIRLTGEKAFQLMFARIVNNVLPVKKGVSNADRITDKAARQKAKEGEENDVDSDEEDDDTPASRFVTYLLKYVLQGFMAKDKNVRYCCVHVSAEMVSGLGEIDEDKKLKKLKKFSARKSAGQGDFCEDMQREEREVYLSDILIDMIQYDSAPEVRRAALLNFSPTQRTLKIILSRTRDVDTILRKLWLRGKRLLVMALEIEGRVCGGAAARMIGTWVNAKDGDLLEILKYFDLLKSKVAEDALLSVFLSHPEAHEAVEFGGMSDTLLTLEKAFLARVFIDRCVTEKDNERLDRLLPVVTMFAFRIEEEYNKLLELLRQLEARNNKDSGSDDEEDEKKDVQLEEQAIDAQLILGELLGFAVNLDYGDETGRRRMTPPRSELPTVMADSISRNAMINAMRYPRDTTLEPPAPPVAPAPPVPVEPPAGRGGRGRGRGGRGRGGRGGNRKPTDKKSTAGMAPLAEFAFQFSDDEKDDKSLSQGVPKNNPDTLVEEGKGE
ncbi:hypothetical protein FRC11_013075 [Ceratobasidium sp. 423]|nr:hypothetical protein FRC11_013075 [Ceratobasidium sp. 423]